MNRPTIFHAENNVTDWWVICDGKRTLVGDYGDPLDVVIGDWERRHGPQAGYTVQCGREPAVVVQQKVRELCGLAEPVPMVDDIEPGG